MLDFILFFPSFSIQSINNSSANIDHPCHLRFASSTVQNFGVLFSISLSVCAFHAFSIIYVLFKMCLKMCFLSIFFLSMCFLFISYFLCPLFQGRNVAILCPDRPGMPPTACLVMTSRYIGLFCGCRYNRSDLFYLSGFL